jgi:hypothetical protein
MKSYLWTGLAVLTALTAIALADDKPKAKPEKPEKEPLPGVFHLPKVTLTSSQQAAIDKLAAQYGARLKQLDEEAHAVLNDEQRAAQKAAREKAHAEGKKGKEAAELADRAAKISQDQQTKLAEIHARKKKLEDEILPQIIALLTPEQRLAAGGRFQEKKPEPPPKSPAKPAGESAQKPEPKK